MDKGEMLRASVSALFMGMQNMDDRSVFQKIQEMQGKYINADVRDQGMWGDEILDEVILKMEPRCEIDSISTGFSSIDEMIGPWGGFGRGEVDVFAGLTGSGKSMLTGAIACNAAELGYQVLIANFEMRREAYLARMLAKLTGVGFFHWMHRIKNVTLPDSEVVEHARSIVRNIKIGDPDEFETTRAIDIELSRGNYDLVCVDYLQCVDAEMSDKVLETYRLKQIMVDFTKLAVKHNVALMTLAQINKAFKQLDRAPTEYDIDSSAWIAKKADRVWAITDGNKPEHKRVTICKNRWWKSGQFATFNTDFKLSRFIDEDNVLPVSEWGSEA